MSMQNNKLIIQQIAEELGFISVGFSKAGFLVEEAPRLESFLKKDYQGKMGYLENHFDKRLDPRELVPGAKTVISFLYNYFPSKIQPSETYQLSKYAYGKDYHVVVKQKLNELVSRVSSKIGSIEGRVFVDSAPVLEKAWASKAGLGWIGKNSNLIHPKQGSFFFIAEWICDLEIEADGPMHDYCGTCNRCIEACPTDAIVEPYVVDGSKCISYLTIELKDQLLPVEMKGKLGNWMYGCDICQDVCPWNKFSKPHNEPAFLPHEQLFELSKNDWEQLSEDVYQELFRKSAVKRAKYNGLKRNILFLSHKS
jgi:epoxyqueuosine reductase